MRLLRGRRGRPFGVALLALLVALLVGPELSPVRVLRLLGHDAYQRWFPRDRANAPAVIVEIDEASLARHGQWPWPRTQLARLLAAIGAADPAAIGVDILMPEPDRLSPARLAPLVVGLDAELAARLARLPSNDAALAETLRTLPVVVGVAGLDSVPPTASVSGVRTAPVRAFGGDPTPFVKRFAAALRSVEEIDAAAPGHGLVVVDVEGGVVRRLPLLAAVGPTLMPAFGLEMLRVAIDTPEVAVRVGPRGIEAVGIGDLLVPTQPDGRVWLRYGRHDPARFVSATEVLGGTADPALFARKLVLVGVTALGLSDDQATPVGERMPGVEIHAQLIEGIFDGDVLSRPWWMGWLEALAVLCGGLVLIRAVPALPVRWSAALVLLLIAGVAALGLALYLGLRLVLDFASPAAALAAVFTAMLGVTLTEAESQRRALRRQVERQREAAARLAGELEAARRIQMGILPHPASVLTGQDRIDLYAFLEPAREVGGDLYDFFPLGDDRIFLLIGDVAGKGLPGSLFMALSKSLCKSIALTDPKDVGAVLRAANREISRDNREGLFVSVFAAVLDARTGELEYANAGHDPAYVLSGGAPPIRQLPVDGGPPLCVIEGFPYAAVQSRLRPGETLCLVTDGVTEAMSAAGELYGRARLEAVLASVGPAAGAEAVGSAIRRDVERFAAGVERADDVAILVVRWHGPRGAAPGARDAPVTGRADRVAPVADGA
jgi:serine phosphatase RsbU (regulator of sigma subunit)/CHASE2 domain-containing sensor protein